MTGSSRKVSWVQCGATSQSPLSVLFEAGCAFEDAGDLGSARDTYMTVLAQNPFHAGALAGLGGLLLRSGYTSAARLVFEQAVQAYPGDASAQARLGHLLRCAGDAEGAIARYRTALACDPLCQPAHQGLSYLLDGRDAADAARHRALGFAGDAALTTRPFRGQGTPVRVLRLVSAVGGNIPSGDILDPRFFLSHALVLEFFPRGAALPAHDVVFTEAGDADRCAVALQAALDIAARSGAPVINGPERVARTGRAGMAALLGGIEGLTLPRTRYVERAALGGLAGEFGLPVLLRSPGFHTGQHFCRVDDVGAMQACAAALPGEELLAIAYLAAPGEDGFFRKYRVMFIGGAILPLHLAISAQWKVHYFTADMGARPEHRAEEARFLFDMPDVLGARAMAALQAMQCALGLDYAGADFALGPDGDVILFEANAAMVIAPVPDGAMWDYRRAAAQAACARARALFYGVLSRPQSCVLQ